MPAVSAPFRAARAAVFAAVCVALSAAGHALMSGDPLPWWAPVAGFVAVFAVAFAGAGRERSFAWIAVPMLLGQAALHTFFAWTSALSMSRMDAGSTGIIDRLLCGHRDGSGHIALPSGWSAERIVAAAGLPPGSVSPALPHSHTTQAMIMHGGTGMVVAHATAALAAAWWLRRGEAALFAVIARLRDEVAVALRAVIATLVRLLGGVTAEGGCAAVGAHRRRDTADAPHPLSALLRHAVIRRGPPVGLRVPVVSAAC